MRLFARQRFAHLALYATLGHCALACGADTDRAPPIGSPTGPIGPIVEKGGNSSADNAGQPGTSLAGGAATTIGTGGDTPGTGGARFGVAGNSAGGNAFGSGGSTTGSDPFGIGGGTRNAFSGMSPF
jgi:hypothetical protein